MPTIPQIGEPQVAPGVPPLVKPYSKGPLELGAGLGAGISDLGVSIQREEAREKAKADAAAIDNALLDVDSAETNLRLEFEKKKGNDAGTAAQPTFAAYEAARAAARSKLTPEQQQEFDRLSGHRSNAFKLSVLSRGAVEQRGYYEDTRQRRQQASIQRTLNGVVEGGLASLDPPAGPRKEGDTSPQTEKEVAYEQIERDAAANDGELGMPKDEWIRLQKEDYDSAETIAVVEGLMQRGDDAEAEAYFQAHQRQITDTKARLSLGSQTEARGKDARVETAAAAILDDASRPGKDGMEPSEATRRATIKAAIESVPAGERKAVRDRIDDMEAEAAEDLRVAQSKNFDDLHQALQDGAPLEEVERTPMFNADDEGGISPDQRDALRVYSQRKTEGGYAATKPEVWKRLETMFKERPGELLKINTRELTSNGSLAEADAREIESLQDKIRKASAGDTGAADGLKLSMTRQQTRDAWAKKLGMGETESGEFDLRLKEIERREQATLGRELTDAEYDTLVQRQTIKLIVDRPWTWDTEKFVFELDDDEADYLSAHPGWMPYDKIPPADREVIIEELRNGGEDVDEFKVREEYVKFLMRYREASK